MIDAEKTLMDEISSAAIKAVDDAIVNSIVHPGHVERREKGHVGTRFVKFRTIDRCYHTCPYFTLEGGPGPIMLCSHPKSPDDGLIISHPDADQGFPAKCPLFHKEK
jgi:hypothetical protein